jgi:hypothetical protein
MSVYFFSPWVQITKVVAFTNFFAPWLDYETGSFSVFAEFIWVSKGKFLRAHSKLI